MSKSNDKRLRELKRAERGRLAVRDQQRRQAGALTAARSRAEQEMR